MHDSHEQARKAAPICDISERGEGVYALHKSEEGYQLIKLAQFAGEVIPGPDASNGLGGAV